MYNRIAKILYFIMLCLLCVSNLGAQETFLCDTTRSVYYVKQNGKGDGSSWKNAMGNETFAYVLPRVKPNTIFHIAEGRYVPVYDSLGAIPQNTKYKVFYTEKPVRLIGGYPANVQNEGVLADPYNNYTYFSGDHQNNDSSSDYEVNRDDNSLRTLWINQKVAGTSEIFGICFTNGSGDKVYHNSMCCVSSPRKLNLTCNVEIKKCYFVKSFKALSSNVTYTEMSECDASQIGMFFTSFNTNLKINACSFVNIDDVFFYSAKNNISTICTNSTFSNIKNNIILDSENPDDVLLFYNNTVADCREFQILSTSKNIISLIGNIFVNTKFYTLNSWISEYNVFCPSSFESYSQTANTDMKVENISSILDYNTGSSSYRAKYNEGFGRTVAVLNKDAKDAILMPRLASQVKYDQRWKERESKTCAGAYDYGCSADTNIYHGNLETIKYHDKGKYTNDVVFEKIGLHYYDTLEVSGSCYQLSRYPVVVTPVLNLTEYYVRVKAKGKGTGTSWNDAMDADMFAYVLANLKSDSCTFYLAEGVYHPNYNEKGLINTNFSNRLFSVKKPVKIIGGYSDTDQPVYNPKSYSTIFSGDILDNDDEDESATFADNVSVLGNVSLDAQANTLFKGVVFTDARNAANSSYHLFHYESADTSSLSFEQCKFSYGGCGLQIHNANTSIKNSIFDHLKSPFLFCYPSTDVSSSSFFDISELTLQSKDEIDEWRLIDEWRFTNCSFMIDNTITINAKTGTNCYFTHNTVFGEEIYISLDDTTNLNMYGNIFGKQINSRNAVVPSSSFHSEYNVHLLPKIKSVSDLFSETDLFLEKKEFKDFISDEWQYVGNSFTPIMPLISDSTQDGKSLRYTQGENPLLQDQIGTKRLKLTCRGAQEYIAPKTEIPTLFTPYTINGKNDVFMKGYEVYIYDIYGMLICHATDGWNGYDNKNKLVAPGIYVYVVDIPKEGIKKGTIEVFK